MTRSLAALERPRAGALATADFELPAPAAESVGEDHEALLEGPAGLQFGSAVVLGAVGLAVAAFLAGFGLGVWWAVPRPL